MPCNKASQGLKTHIAPLALEDLLGLSGADGMSCKGSTQTVRVRKASQSRRLSAYMLVAVALQE